MPAEPRIAVDGGQSITKVRFRDEAGTATDIELPGVRTDRPLVPQLLDVVRRARATFGPFAVAAFGVSGLTDDESDPAPIVEAERAAGLRRAVLAHDSVTAYLSAQGTRHGVVVAAGTGVVTLAVGPTSSARVDGWGWIMGDAGSGYWIGRAALEAVMRAYDGRGPATTLTVEAQRIWSDLPSAYIALQADPDRVSRVASFSGIVGALAATDDVARTILERAGAELATSAETAWRRVAGDDPAPVVRTLGGVFRSPVVHDSFAADLRRSRPQAEVSAGVPHGLDGAEALIDLDEDGPFAALVSSAQAG